MPEQRKRPTRTRIDTILNAIAKGEYDDKLSDIRDTVEARYAEKRAEVLEKVKEVYGPEFEITEKPHPNVFIGRAKRTPGDGVQVLDEDAVRARAEEVAQEIGSADGNDQPGSAPGDPFGDGNVVEGQPAKPQAVEIVSAPERGASPAFGSEAVIPPSQGDVHLAADDDGYESRSPIIKGGPPE